MKTLILTLEYPPQTGGIASYIIGFTEQMPAGDIVIYAPRLTGDSAYDQRRPWKVYRRTPLVSFVWPHWIKAVFDVWRICRREKIRQMHVHHILPLGYAALIVKRFLKIPYVIFLHGSDFQVAAKSATKRKKFRWICRQADRVIVNSEFSKRQLAEMIDDASRVVIVYPCPNDNFITYLPQPDELHKLRSALALEGKKVVLSVARLADRKGHLLLAVLLPKILEQIPNLVWVIIGDGPKKDGLIQLIQKNNLQSITRFLPSLDTSELPKYYYLANLFV